MSDQEPENHKWTRGEYVVGIIIIVVAFILAWHFLGDEAANERCALGSKCYEIEQKHQGIAK